MIIAIDPSLRATGYVVYDPGEKKIVDSGCIKTEKESGSVIEDNIRRIRKIVEVIDGKIREYDCNKMWMELIGGSQSASAARGLGSVLGLLVGYVYGKDVELKWLNKYSINDIIFGKNSVEKEEAIEYAKSRWPREVFKDVKYRDEAISDSILVLEAGVLSDE